ARSGNATRSSCYGTARSCSVARTRRCDRPTGYTPRCCSPRAKHCWRHSRLDGIGLGTVLLRTLTGHAPVRVDDPEVVWIVESGSLLVFAVTLVNGEPHGARRYLFTAAAGDPLFCLPTSVGADQRAILAVPLGDPTVREYPISGG